MLLKVSKSNIKTGSIVKIPGSKSHTIRALFIASLAQGQSEIVQPLFSDDALSAVEVCKALGAEIYENGENFKVYGFEDNPSIPDDIVDVGNSGTTLRFGVTAAALAKGYTILTGDRQIRNRPMEPLIRACNDLGAKIFSTRNNGMAPIVVKGRMVGGITEIDAYTSQFLSSLLITCPLLEKDTEIVVTQLNEKPYVEMTLWWLDKQGISYYNDDFKSIYVRGNQKYKPLKTVIPGDFSSATFFMVLAAISGKSITLENLDMTDPQGDKLVLSFLENMGAKVTYQKSNVTIKGDKLHGIKIDMNFTPDALPAMAVAGCFADGETRLLNVPQARLKETDRISVMCHELRKMGADISELSDGLIIKKSKLTGCEVNGHYDHRVAMALAIAGLSIEGTTVIDTAESIGVTFPEFIRLIKHCGGNADTY